MRLSGLPFYLAQAAEANAGQEQSTKAKAQSVIDVLKSGRGCLPQAIKDLGFIRVDVKRLLEALD